MVCAFLVVFDMKRGWRRADCMRFALMGLVESRVAFCCWISWREAMVIWTRPKPPPLGTPDEYLPVPGVLPVALVDGVPILVPLVFYCRFDSFLAWLCYSPEAIVLKVPAVWGLLPTGIVCMAAADWLFKLKPRLHESFDWVLLDERCLLMWEGCLFMFYIRVELAVDSRFINRVYYPCSMELLYYVGCLIYLL